MAILPRRAFMAWVLLCTGAWAAEFPYTAYVTANAVDVRSGPGKNYYPVLKLRRGQAVEVYRHDPGGWYAIRPPEGAFSWVSAEFIEPGEGHIGLVTGDRVAVRVGTEFGDTRNVIQVRLDCGEEVRILEARAFQSGSDTRTWYKIAPPAGEFRWISGRYLADHDEAEAEADEGDLDDAEQSEVRQVAHREPAGHRAARRRKHREPAEDAEEDEDQSSGEGPLPGPVRSFLSHRQPKTDFKEEAADLDLALSAIVAEETADWDFTILRRQADAALARAETAVERGHIRRVLRKIDNFAEIQQRYAAVMRRSDRDVEQSRLTRRPNSLDSSPFSSPSGGDRTSRFDGEGRLTQITTADPHTPQFALVDGAGQVTAYVAPAPGVNLRRYLNQEVGIHGTRGYLADRQARTLTARRIETLGDSRLR